MDVREMRDEIESAHEQVEEAMGHARDAETGLTDAAAELEEAVTAAADAQYVMKLVDEHLKEVHDALDELVSAGEALKHGDVVVRPPRGPEEATGVFLFVKGQLVPMSLEAVRGGLL